MDEAQIENEDVLGDEIREEKKKAEEFFGTDKVAEKDEVVKGINALIDSVSGSARSKSLESSRENSPSKPLLKADSIQVVSETVHSASSFDNSN